MKTKILAAILLAGAQLALAGCSGSEEPVEQTSPDAPEGLKVSDAKLMLPAVSGNPAAVYFTIENKGPKDRFIRAVSVQGAKDAMVHVTTTWNRQTDMQEVLQQPVRQGETVKFEPGGLHVMADGLDDSLVAGGETEVTLTFAGGDKISFPAEIHAAGDER